MSSRPAVNTLQKLSRHFSVSETPKVFFRLSWQFTGYSSQRRPHSVSTTLHPSKQFGYTARSHIIDQGFGDAEHREIELQYGTELTDQSAMDSELGNDQQGSGEASVTHPDVAPTKTQGSQPIASSKGRKSKHALRKQQITNMPKGSRIPPSEGSGGVPDPTPSYLLQASSPPSRLSSPRRILVIIDLNGTLLYRPSKKNPTRFIERPHAQRFLSYCLDTFAVGFWSSARAQNVNNMLTQLLTPEQRSKSAFIWSRSHFGLTAFDFDARVQCYKRLTKVWENPTVQNSHPGSDRGEKWDQSNTILVDDSIEKARSEPHNLLEIPEFVGMNQEMSEVLPQVHDYLNELCYQSDVSSYVKSRPFELNPDYKLVGEDATPD